MEPAGALERYQGLRDKRNDPLRRAITFERPHYATHIRECIDWALKLSPRERPYTAFALQRGLMGHGMSNKKRAPQSTVNFRSGFIGIPKIAMQLEDESKIKRGFLEKLLIGLVVLAVVSILTRCATRSRVRLASKSKKQRTQLSRCNLCGQEKPSNLNLFHPLIHRKCWRTR